MSGNAALGNSSYLNVGAEPLAASIDEQLLRSILEKELAQKFLKLGGFAFFDGADPPNMVHCAVLTDYPSEAQAAMATYRASPPTDRPRRVAQDELSELEMDERVASFNLSGEQHMEFSAPMPLHASDDRATFFYGAYELDPARPNQLSGVLRGKLARRVRFDPVRSEAAGRPVATAWLNRDDLPTPKVRDANGQERVIDLKMRAGGFVVFHDFACKQFASSKTTLETALALSDDVVIERVFSNTPLAQLDYFQAHLLDNLNHFPVNVGPFQTLQDRKSTRLNSSH
jgi:hypothetical protein